MCTLPLPTLHTVCFRCQNDSARCKAAGIEGAVAEEPIKPGSGRKKTIGIREIADALGMSIGTVDHTLHNRPGANLKAKAECSARALKLNRKIRIAVVPHLAKTACNPQSTKAISDPNWPLAFLI